MHSMKYGSQPGNRDGCHLPVGGWQVIRGAISLTLICKLLGFFLWVVISNLFYHFECISYHISFSPSDIRTMVSETVPNAHTNGTTDTRNKDWSIFLDDRIPISPSAPQEVPSLLNQITSHGDAFLHTDPGARLRLLEDARSLVNALETPRESMIRYCWAQVGLLPQHHISAERKWVAKCRYMYSRPSTLQSRQALISIYSISYHGMTGQSLPLSWQRIQKSTPCCWVGSLHLYHVV